MKIINMNDLKELSKKKTLKKQKNKLLKDQQEIIDKIKNTDSEIKEIK